MHFWQLNDDVFCRLHDFEMLGDPRLVLISCLSYSFVLSPSLLFGFYLGRLYHR